MKWEVRYAEINGQNKIKIKIEQKKETRGQVSHLSNEARQVTVSQSSGFSGGEKKKKKGERY